MSNGKILGILIGALICGSVGGFVVHELTVPQTIVEQSAGASPTGSTFTQQKQLAITMNLASGTSTSVQNTGSTDVYLTTFNLACTGVGSSQTAYTGAGLANLTVKAATTSTSFSSNTPTSNTAVPNSNLSLTTTNIATSSATTVVSSSSIQDITTSFMIIPAGAYLTFITNATNTATCTFGAEYLGS